MDHNLHVNKTNFHMKGLGTHFETEAKCNSEIVYWMNHDKTNQSKPQPEA